MFSLKSLNAFFEALPPIDKLWVAHSGGLDSQVLLHVLATEIVPYYSWQLAAIHINHGLQAEAAQWQQFCQATCQQLGVEFHCFVVQATADKGQSPEAAARQARYHALARCITENHCLVTAHHLDDQAETLLLQLCRGAGVAGLAAMPELSEFAHGYHGRPLLHYTRQQLERYALQQQLQWVDDSSNQNQAFDRNFIRHQVMPVLRERWPSVATTIARSASHCAGAAQVNSSYAQERLKDLQQGDELLIEPLLALPRAEQALLIREWLKQRQLPMPSSSQCEQILDSMLSCAVDAMPLVSWEGAQLRRYAGLLYAMPPLAPFDNTVMIDWDTSQPCQLPSGLGTLTLDMLDENLRHDRLTVAFRRGGERVRRPGQGRSQSLKHLLQQQGVPPWLRDRVPLIYRGDQLLAVILSTRD